MAVLITYLKPGILTPEMHNGLFTITERRTIDNTAANGGAYPLNGDNIQILNITRNCRMVECDLAVRGTLGAGATVKVQKNTNNVRTDLTVASTAGAASIVNSNTIGAVDLVAGDIIELLVGGANVSAIANIELDLQIQH